MSITKLDSNRFNDIAIKYHHVSDTVVNDYSDNIKPGKHSKKRNKQVTSRLLRGIGFRK